MKTLLKLVVLIVVVVAGVGFYLGWFHLSSRSDESKPNISLTLDKDKFEADKDKLMEKVTPESDEDNSTEKVAPESDKATK
jgi:beta-lactam-binding protein with PASTA domain